MVIHKDATTLNKHFTSLTDDKYKDLLLIVVHFEGHIFYPKNKLNSSWIFLSSEEKNKMMLLSFASWLVFVF